MAPSSPRCHRSLAVRAGTARRRRAWASPERSAAWAGRRPRSLRPTRHGRPDGEPVAPISERLLPVEVVRPRDPFSLSPREHEVLGHHRRGPHQPRDRGAPLHQRAHRGRPRARHPRQARCLRSSRGGQRRHPAGPRAGRRPSCEVAEPRRRLRPMRPIAVGTLAADRQPGSARLRSAAHPCDRMRDTWTMRRLTPCLLRTAAAVLGVSVAVGACSDRGARPTRRAVATIARRTRATSSSWS